LSIFRELRGETGLNQTEYAGLFNLSQQAVSGYENVIQFPDMDIIEKSLNITDVLLITSWVRPISGSGILRRLRLVRFRWMGWMMKRLHRLEGWLICWRRSMGSKQNQDITQLIQSKISSSPNLVAYKQL